MLLGAAQAPVKNGDGDEGTKEMGGKILKQMVMKTEMKMEVVIETGTDTEANRRPK